jgi:hypothetical protein
MMDSHDRLDLEGHDTSGIVNPGRMHDTLNPSFVSRNVWLKGCARPARCDRQRERSIGSRDNVIYGKMPGCLGKRRCGTGIS